MPEPLRQREPAIKDRAYLGWIARLPCVACLAEGHGLRYGVHVAHLRVSSLEYGKRHCGKGEKPSDRPWTLPLCPPHHMNDRQAQHNVGEEVFYTRLQVNPFALCLALAEAQAASRSGIPVITAHAGPERRAWRSDLFP